MHTTVELLYGREKLAVPLPDDCPHLVLRKPKMPELANPQQAVWDALENGVSSDQSASLALAQLAADASSACIVVCDITRPVPNRLFLRPVIETLLKQGIDKGAISVLVATGLHRPNLGDELLELIGDPWVLENVEVVNHDARSDRDHINLGKTSTRGTPVLMDRRLVEADLKIATGLVEPHFMAGYSGGRKVIAPGVAHASTIQTFHSYRFMADPAAANCNLHGNPLHEEQIEIVKMLDGALAINTVIDEDRNLAFINFGEINASHGQAVEFIERFCRIPLPQHFDLVITSGAGYPLDKTYYQTVKGMVGAMDILKPGGDLVIASQCSEGLGSPEYIDAQKRLTSLGPKPFLDTLKNKPLADIDEWQAQMQTKPMAIGNIHLYSDLSEADHKLTGVHRITDWKGALANLSKDKTVVVIPEGPYVIPYVSERR